jgi:hypothetical protein
MELLYVATAVASDPYVNVTVKLSLLHCLYQPTASASSLARLAPIDQHNVGTSSSWA